MNVLSDGKPLTTNSGVAFLSRRFRANHMGYVSEKRYARTLGDFIVGECRKRYSSLSADGALFAWGDFGVGSR